MGDRPGSGGLDDGGAEPCGASEAPERTHVAHIASRYAHRAGEPVPGGQELRQTHCRFRRIAVGEPRVEIYFFTSLRFFRSDADPEAFSAYIQAQKDCCAHYGIPVLDQYHLQGVNRFNCKEFYKKDLLHMTEEGYRRIAPVQAAFLANGQ